MFKEITLNLLLTLNTLLPFTNVNTIEDDFDGVAECATDKSIAVYTGAGKYRLFLGNNGAFAAIVKGPTLTVVIGTVDKAGNIKETRNHIFMEDKEPHPCKHVFPEVAIK